MAHRKIDRVQQASTWAGASTLALDIGPPPRMRSFASVLTNGDQCWVLIEHQTLNEWEISLATYNSGAIVRTFAAGSSSSTGGLVNFSNGGLTISLVAPAGATPIVDGSGNLSVTGRVTAETDLTVGPWGSNTTGFTQTAVVFVGNNADASEYTRLSFGQTAPNVMYAEVADEANVKGKLCLAPFGGWVGVGGVPGGPFDVQSSVAGDVNMRVLNGSTDPTATAGLMFALTNVPNAYTFARIERGIAPVFAITSAPGVTGGIHLRGLTNIQQFVDGVGKTHLDASSYGPYVDNVLSSARAGVRWTVVYAATGTINTSDEREKRDFRSLTEEELRVARAVARLIKVYRWKDAYEVKGEAARYHFGWVAQQVVAAFAAEGLDAFAYGCVGFDPVTKVENYNETEQRQKSRTVQVEAKVVRIVEGRPTMVTEMREQTEPAGTWSPVVDEVGATILVPRPPRRDENGNEIAMPPTPMLHFVPEMETVEVERQRTVAVLDDNGEQLLRMNVRYEELQALVVAGLEARLATFEPAE